MPAKLRIILIRKSKRYGHFAFLKIAAMGYESERYRHP
jgi:hypothetical protein